jgi:hypothetical protein
MTCGILIHTFWPCVNAYPTQFHILMQTKFQHKKQANLTHIMPPKGELVLAGALATSTTFNHDIVTRVPTALFPVPTNYKASACLLRSWNRVLCLIFLALSSTSSLVCFCKFYSHKLEHIIVQIHSSLQFYALYRRLSWILGRPITRFCNLNYV